MKIDYDSLACLASIVREGSFDGAAKKLGVTQSAVSQRLKTLEDNIGGLLIVRGRPCVSTVLGQQLIQHIEQISVLEFDLYARMRSLLTEGSTGFVTVRIAVNNDSLATWFPGVLERAGNELNVLVDIVSDDQEHTGESLVSGDVLAVVSSNDTPPQGCKSTPLGSMNYVAVANPEFYKRNFSDGVTLASLEGSKCIAFDRKDTLPDQWMASSFGGTAKVLCHYVPSFEGYTACCLNGAGWGMAPWFSIKRQLASGELIELSPGRSLVVPLNWQSTSLQSDLLDGLQEIVREEAQKMISTTVVN